MYRRDHSRGFTLIEVLIALGITAFVATLAYTGLSAAIAGVEATRESGRRTAEINRAWSILSRDLQHFVARPVRDEFGDEEPALVGGPAARFPLSFTRAGWTIPSPPATMFAWARIPEQFQPLGSVGFAKLLIEKADLAVSPGVGFGEYGEGYVRIALVENEHRIRQAARNVRRFLSQANDAFHNMIPSEQERTSR